MQDEIYLKKHEIFEKKLMDMLLAGEQELFVKLRRQYETAKVKERKFDGYGFFTYFEIFDKSLNLDDVDIVLNDVFIDYDDIDCAYSANLFIKDGFIIALDGYPLGGDEWIEDYDKIDDMHYWGDEVDEKPHKRKINHLIKKDLPTKYLEGITLQNVDLKKHEIFEKNLMNMLLAGEQELFARLRKQYEVAKVKERKFYNYGFLTYFEITSESPSIDDCDLYIDGVYIDCGIEDGVCSAALSIEKGFINMLIGYPHGDFDWIKNYDKVRDIYYLGKTKLEKVYKRETSRLRKMGLPFKYLEGITVQDIDPKKHEIFEKKLMDMLLAGEQELFVKLRKQYEAAKIKEREFNVIYGFTTSFEIDDRSLGLDDRSFTISDIRIRYDGAEDAYGAKLYIKNGFIDTLKGYASTNDGWIEDYDRVDDMYYKIGETYYSYFKKKIWKKLYKRDYSSLKNIGQDIPLEYLK
jgi:hypothetical protein